MNVIEQLVRFRNDYVHNRPGLVGATDNVGQIENRVYFVLERLTIGTLLYRDTEGVEVRFKRLTGLRSLYEPPTQLSFDSKLPMKNAIYFLDKDEVLFDVASRISLSKGSSGEHYVHFLRDGVTVNPIELWMDAATDLPSGLK